MLLARLVAGAAGLATAFGVCRATFVALMVIDVQCFREIELTKTEATELHVSGNALPKDP